MYYHYAIAWKLYIYMYVCALYVDLTQIITRFLALYVDSANQPQLKHVQCIHVEATHYYIQIFPCT